MKSEAKIQLKCECGCEIYFSDSDIKSYINCPQCEQEYYIDLRIDFYKIES